MYIEMIFNIFEEFLYFFFNKAETAEFPPYLSFRFKLPVQLLSSSTFIFVCEKPESVRRSNENNSL